MAQLGCPCETDPVWSRAGAAEPSTASILGVPEGYLGLGQSKFVDVHFAQMTAGIKAYYALHERWPANWAAVKQDGLVTVPLVSPQGIVLDPDDGRLDCDFDLIYNAKPDGSDPDCILLHAKCDKRPIRLKLVKPPTYRTILLQLDRARAKRNPGSGQTFTAWLDDPARMKLFAISMINNSLLVAFHGTKAGRVDSWQAFVASGCASVTPADVNPLTGQSWQGSGGPDNLVWDHGKQVDAERLHQLGLTLPGGEFVEIL
jgi:hypothetical protein